MAVFDYHKKKGYADLYSLHSWCGLLVFVLYLLQVSPLGPTKGGRKGQAAAARGRTRSFRGGNGAPDPRRPPG